MDEIAELETNFSSKIERGINFNFVRLDAALEPEFSKMFAGDKDSITEPMVVVMNPGKRKRYLKHDGPINSTSITQTLDMILGGDARFKPLKNF